MGTRSDLPSGTVTFLFTDVEGSTRLLHALGADAYAQALATHRRILRGAFTAHGGVEVDTQGDAFFVAFPTAPGALAAATEAAEALRTGPIQVRIGLHTGTPLLTDEGYVGPDVHKGARIAAAGHGGQILVSAVTAQLLSDALKDLGEHRLKDLAAPERIFQADDGAHPPLKTISNSNLPHPLDSFVGREREVADVVDLVSGGARLVTLTGPGGTGKTRLALAAAAELVGGFDDGVFWVPVAALRDPALVLDEIATVIGARATLEEAIGDRAMLLVLDNLEQVVDVGRDLAALLEACPNLRLLATSRELLRVRGEHEYAVPPLAEREAVALFAERSGRTDERAAELCRRLDNLPLAVELAAARSRLLTPGEILDRLAGRLDLFRGGRDLDPRQATLRATIDWSHELLEPEERRVFAELAVFRGGWTVEAAESVTGAHLESLESRADKSLITEDSGRYRMLETIATYADERLTERADAEAIRARHAAQVHAWVQRRYQERYEPEDAWLPAVMSETDNVRAALAWAEDHDPALATDLVGMMAPLWWPSGRAGEVRRWLSAALAWVGPDSSRARVLTHLGEVTDDLGPLTEALKLRRQLGDRDGEAETLEGMGWVHDSLGQYTEAADAHRASLTLRADAGSPEVRALGARAGLCHVLVATNRPSHAREAARDLLAAARRTRAAYMEEMALHFLADADLLEGNWPSATAAYRMALTFAADHEFTGRAVDEVIGMAMAMAGAGQCADALRIAAAARSKQAEIGKGTDAWWASMQHRILGAARASLSEADAVAAESAGVATPFEAIVAELRGPEHS